MQGGFELPILPAHHVLAADRVVAALQAIFTMNPELEADIRAYIVLPQPLWKANRPSRQESIARADKAHELALQLIHDEGQKRPSVPLRGKMREKVMNGWVNYLRAAPDNDLTNHIANALEKLPDFSAMETESQVTDAFDKWVELLATSRAR